MKKLMLLLLMGTLLVGTSMAGPADGGGNDNDPVPPIRRTPTQSPHVYINYDESTGIATVRFNTTILDAAVVILKDGVEVDSMSETAVEGMQLSFYLPAYVDGEFAIQVTSGDTLIAILNV